MIEKYLVMHCAPTLAGLKTANLFNYSYNSKAELFEHLKLWNKAFQCKGIEIILLKCNETSALIYVCRKSRLQNDLRKPGVKRFLKQFGYKSTDAEYAIKRLKKRLKYEDSFPHEIGIFLDYPLGDVIGFIKNAGENCKCAGCWKVYCNECEAIRTFEKYNKCREVYSRLWSNGNRNIMQLTVAA